jgi:hypothetical protein
MQANLTTSECQHYLQLATCPDIADQHVPRASWLSRLLRQER